jgi:hypothetical protein
MTNFDKISVHNLFLVVCTFPWLPLAATSSTTGTGLCKPATWTNSDAPTGLSSSPKPQRTWTVHGDFAFTLGEEIQAGEINCRMFGETDEHVDSQTCLELADHYHLDIAKFFTLNPVLHKDCSNVRPMSKYCVAGCECLT